jgi:peptide/nickel transport system permease protein
MILIMLVVSFILFLLFEGDKMRVATQVLSQFSTVEQRLIWLEDNGYNAPFLTRYLAWVFNFITGNWGTSIQFNTPVSDLILPRLANTGILGGLVFVITIAISLVLGVLSGIAETSFRDRAITVVSVLTTSVPEFASATLMVAVFVFWLGWLPGTSSFADGFSWSEMVMPVAVLVLFNFGYYTRMTRASMAEVMTSQYIRTAVLKGIPYRDVVLKHALRNGVIVVEVFFSYKGFGKLLYDAATFGDIFVVGACTMIAVSVVVLSQIISDVGYMFLNPRIRYS